MSLLTSMNPATGEAVGSVPLTPSSEVPSIVARARAAQSAWAATPTDERAAILQRAHGLFTERADTIGNLITLEMGKPLRDAMGEAHHVAELMTTDPIEVAEALTPEDRQSDRVHSTIFRDPFGVAACISPWNFPLLMPHVQVIPALVAGNSVVLKPSEETPLVGQAYAEALQEVLPPDVLQVIHGADEQGKALVASDVDLVVFTGSRAAGKHILGAASRELKRVILELGGKDPLIVLDDANIDDAAKFAARNSFRNAGQVCVSTERIYVMAQVHDAFVDALCHHAAAMQMGNGLDPQTRVGPMVNRHQKDHVANQLTHALAAGATVAWQGKDLGGNFHPAVVLTGVRQDMDIAREETFGPIATVIAMDNEDQAIAAANDTPYGLGAVVYGSDERAWRAARQLTAGMVGVNQGLNAAEGTPWVGARQSGYGFHSGPEGHRQFAQVRVISRTR